MLNKCLIILLFPASVFAQSTMMSNAEFERIVETDCNGKEFYKTEVLPSLKISREAFADSLTHFLQSKNIVIKNRLVPFRFFLTTYSRILKLRLATGSIASDTQALGDAILHFSDLWNPAVQNSRNVCSFVSLLLEFSADKIDVVILQ